MIRAVLGTAVSLAGVGLAAAYLWPRVAGPGGEPMVVAPAAPGYQLASLDGTACGAVLLLTDRPAGNAGQDAAHTVVALQLGAGNEPVAISQVAVGPNAGDVVIFVLDDAGRILGAGYPAGDSGQDCLSAPQAPAGSI